MKPLGWALTPSTGTLIREIRIHRETAGMCAYRGKTMWGHREKAAVCKSRREASEETKLAETLILGFSLLICEKVKFCCLTYPFCSILLWQININGNFNEYLKSVKDCNKRLYESLLEGRIIPFSPWRNNWASEKLNNL